MKVDYLRVVTQFIHEHHSTAQAVFWGGSIARGQGNENSDLDLVIVYDKLSNAFRETLKYNECDFDLFVHDTETLCYFLQDESRDSGIPATMNMILKGICVLPPSIFSEKIIAAAKASFELGPTPWEQDRIDRERFLITDALRDIQCPSSREKCIATTAQLYEKLAQFYFRAASKWSATGKNIVNALEADNPELARQYTTSFNEIFLLNKIGALEQLVTQILEPYGGQLWMGYYSDAPVDFRKASKKHNDK